MLKLGLMLHLNPGLEWNYDERRNGRIADNYLAGRGYTSLDPERNIIRPDAFHASFPVFVYIGWQKAGLPKHYFTLLVFVLSTGLYILGGLYVQRTLAYFGVAPPLSWAAGLLWLLCPSNVYYIGAYMWYENIALPLLILVVYKLIRLLDGRILLWSDAVLIIGSVVLSCLLRGYLLAVYGIVFFIWVLLAVHAAKSSVSRNTILAVSVALALLLAHLPILQKNHRLFGVYILSNQAGFELLQGHNSITQGRFMFDWDERTKPFDQFVRVYIPDLDSLNQYEESQARAQLAIKWVLAHPAEELILCLRKTALFLSPENFIADAPRTTYNVFTALISLAFLVSFTLVVSNFRNLTFQHYDMLLLGPIIAVWLLSLFFFVGFRWRYFAEPSMLMYPILIWQRLQRTDN
ncbi:hypothetical protein SAMN02745146_0978 [Hymenobacter daecheongensis DSM 21074]|uniref:Dolichyl-phosphate-mannose-protein mannosyltransferase n=2 Tax=Hymenobacter daecheongensis TaxID=496053 RepID=A0A1M6BEP7_9BACT|nr:hypothetical protein SAMN02745146_0978 [Hymenobacter daecheongensis DSM 21074]